MYEELIENLNPKPQINMKWYDGKNLYSEGEIEDTIVHIIAENDPEDYVQAIANNYCWSVYYHLTDVRKNIINWYDMNPEGSVLEIGCGMGAVTATLCEKCKSVTAVELSQRRAIGTLLRCREMDNLEIIVGNLNDIEFKEKFDYITLIGVLEYQGSYTETTSPYLDFLKKIKSLLKPNGKLLIAIENQYGLKYWCGAKEDHTGMPFEGLNQYSISEKKVRTFSKSGLERLVKESGFKNVFFYYPMPDYKLPMAIYSQDYLPVNGNMLNMKYYYVPNAKTLIAQEEKIYNDIIENHVFDFFANSFLVECSEEEDIGRVKFASLSCKRFPEYQIGTKIVNYESVEKFALRKEIGKTHLHEIASNEKCLMERGLKVIESVIESDKLVTKYIDAPTAEEVLLKAYQRRDESSILNMFDKIYTQIQDSSEPAEWTDNVLYTLGLGIVPNEKKYGVILKIGYLDMILRNAFYIDNQFVWFDQEWKLENVPVNYVMYRVLIRFYSAFQECALVIPLATLVKRYDVLFGVEDYQRLDDLFMGVVADQIYLQEYDVLCTSTEEQCLQNIRGLLREG